MKIEYEATFAEIDKDKIRKKLKSIGARLIKKEFLQRRYVFHLPKGYRQKGTWARVRDEGDRITMSIKRVSGNRIEDQKEICLEINDFEGGKSHLEVLGCKLKAFQESKREIWEIDKVEATIDEWPFLEPFIELEGGSEKEVKDAVKKLGLDYDNALFCSVDTLYSKKYKTPKSVINNKTPIIKFGGKNPFVVS